MLKKRGEEYMAAKKYAPALEAFLEYEKARPAEATVLSNIGICYFHLNDLKAARKYLNLAMNARQAPLPEAYLYFGKLFHEQYEFEQAAFQYKRFLQKAANNHPFRAAVKDDILRCATGLRVRRAPSLAAVVNLGETVNSGGDDFKPILSPNDPDRIYFSSARPGNAGCTKEDCKTDIFYTDLADGDWEKPRPMSLFLNSVQHDVALDFNDDGTRLYLFRGATLFSGDIFVDTFRENALERTLLLPEFDGPMRPWEGDRSLQFFNDTVLLFSSRRAGGYGGLDLYVATFTKGRWTVPQNLGPVINSAYDETSPFLATDGRTLYFSTNDPRRSMGGLDILRSVYLDHTQRWTPPVNLGSPINSAADDEHFCLTACGKEAFFASARKQGFGGRDLYVALFDFPRPEQAARSLPVAFNMVPAYKAALAGASEAGAQPDEYLIDEITTLVWPVFPPPEIDGPFSEEALRSLRLLAAIMKKFPALQITFAVHSAKGDNGPGVCENTQRHLEAFFRMESVSFANTSFCCAASSWTLDPNQPTSNRRIEVFAANPELLPFTAEHTELPPGTSARFFQKSMSGLCYHVAVEINGGEGKKLWDIYPNGMTVTYLSSGWIYFTPGLYLTFNSAEEWRKKLERDGYPSAKVTALLNGREVTRAEAVQYVSEFPDLKFFVER